MTAKDYIAYFEARLRQLDDTGSNRLTGEKPQYPMLVSFVGEESMTASRYISRSLSRLWPQFQTELQFVGVTFEREKLSYYDCNDTGEGSYKPLEPRYVGIKVEELYDTATHFSDYNMLLLYHVINTTGMSAAEFQQAISAVQQLKKDLHVDEHGIMEMFFVLLDESPSNRSAYKEIRSLIANLTNSTSHASTYCILSNKRDDNRILRSWETQYNVMCAVIATSNCSDAQIVSGMFSAPVVTASYAREEKPTRSICQFFVKELLIRLAMHAPKPVISMVEDELPEKLGLSEQGTLSVLDDYVKTNLMGLIPTGDQLELFPRADAQEYRYNPEDMTAEEFNSATMGAWEAYLNGLGSKTQDLIGTDTPVSRKLREKYAAVLRKNFEAGELIYLCEHPDKIARQFERLRRPAKELKILRYGEEYLKYLVCGNEELQEVFQAEVRQMGMSAIEYLRQWNELYQSISSLHDIREGQDFEQFYGGLVRDYFDVHGTGIVAEFKHIATAEALDAFIKRILEDISTDDHIKVVLRASFEDELKQRLSKSGEQIDVNRYISEKLSYKKVPTYLQIAFDKGYPTQFFVLLKKDTHEDSLYTTFKEKADVPESTFYYDTGSNASVEVLNIFTVSPEKLLIGD